MKDGTNILSGFWVELQVLSQTEGKQIDFNKLMYKNLGLFFQKDKNIQKMINMGQNLGGFVDIGTMYDQLKDD